MNIPAELVYAETDEWVKVEGNDATIGISDYAQDQLSDIVFIDYVGRSDDTVAKASRLPPSSRSKLPLTSNAGFRHRHRRQ
jgi:glycine cleavage system H protein